jgi:hypothetical protein
MRTMRQFKFTCASDVDDTDKADQRLIVRA